MVVSCLQLLQRVTARNVAAQRTEKRSLLILFMVQSANQQSNQRSAFDGF
jgi:hypothetical protein